MLQKTRAASQNWKIYFENGKLILHRFSFLFVNMDANV